MLVVKSLCGVEKLGRGDKIVAQSSHFMELNSSSKGDSRVTSWSSIGQSEDTEIVILWERHRFALNEAEALYDLHCIIWTSVAAVHLSSSHLWFH